MLLDFLVQFVKELGADPNYGTRPKLATSPYSCLIDSMSYFTAAAAAASAFVLFYILSLSQPRPLVWRRKGDDRLSLGLNEKKKWKNRNWIVSIVMATTQSLLGLVNQLNSMEATFSTVMMEAVMKLASLTGESEVGWDG